MYSCTLGSSIGHMLHLNFCADLYLQLILYCLKESSCLTGTVFGLLSSQSTSAKSVFTATPNTVLGSGDPDCSVGSALALFSLSVSSVDNFTAGSLSSLEATSSMCSARKPGGSGGSTTTGF